VKRCYALRNGTIEDGNTEHAEVFAFVAPDRADATEISRMLGISQADIEAALDPDEISRVDVSSRLLSVIWKRPKNATVDEGELRFDVALMGLFQANERLVVISTDDMGGALTSRQLCAVRSTKDVFLQLLRNTIHHYLGHLKVIKQVTQELSRKISASMSNVYFLQMFALAESLIYYIDAIDANGAVLAKLRANADRLALTGPQQEALSDLILDNQQCSRQAQIHSGVLSGLMDARGTIINNNVSLLLRNLTLITVIFLPLNLIASIGGMSEFTMMTGGIDWRISFSAFTAAMLVIGWVSYRLLVRFYERRETSRRGK
jgi:magnesium transporter